MIEDDNQLAISLLWANRFRQAIDRLGEQERVHPKMQELQKASLLSTIEDLEEEVKAYLAKKYTVAGNK